MSEVITLGGKKKKEWASIGEQLGRLEKMPTPIRILASPKTTAVLGTTLASLLNPATAPATIWKGTKILGGVALAEGLIEKSPRVESFAKRKLRPERAGEFIGEEIEKFGKEDKENSLTWKEKAKEGLKKAGLIGGGIALAGAGALAVKKAVPFVKEKLEQRKLEKEASALKELKEAQFRPVQPVGLGGVPITQPVEISGYGAPDGTKTPSPISNIIQIQLA